MSGPAQTSLHEPKSDTCDISPIHNDCRKAEPGGSPAQDLRPRRSTDRWAYERCQWYRARHRTAIRRVRLSISSTIPFYGWFGAEARISLALACPRINRRRPPRGMGAGDLLAADRFRAPRPWSRHSVPATRHSPPRWAATLDLRVPLRWPTWAG